MHKSKSLPIFNYFIALKKKSGTNDTPPAAEKSRQRGQGRPGRRHAHPARPPVRGVKFSGVRETIRRLDGSKLVLLILLLLFLTEKKKLKIDRNRMNFEENNRPFFCFKKTRFSFKFYLSSRWTQFKNLKIFLCAIFCLFSVFSNKEYNLNNK